MPVFTLFMSLIIAAITGMILQSIFAQDNFTPEWINQVVYSIIAIGFIASLPIKEALCKVCKSVTLKKLNLCHCNSQ